MPPKHCQLRALCPKASGNAFQALVDPPHDGNNLSFDGGDERTDGGDDNTIVIVNPRDSGPPASPNQQNNGTAFQDWLEDNIIILSKQMNLYGDDSQRGFIAMDNRLLGIKANQL
jgi:hypothetical protein